MSSLQNYDMDEAARILRCRKRFLQDNLARLPHQKIGQAVVFDETELAAIKEMCRVRPETPTAAQDRHLTLASISPSKSARRTG